MDKHEVILELYTIGAVQFGSFQLKSGQISPIYLDLRKIVSFPKLLRQIAALGWEEIRDRPFDRILGVPYTALPIATVMSIHSGVPMLMRRKEIKHYGLKRKVEGVFQEGQRVLVVEDVITSGQSVLETIEDMEAEGLVVPAVLVMIDREQGGRERLESLGFSVQALFKMSEVIDILEPEIGSRQASEVRQFFREFACPK